MVKQLIKLKKVVIVEGKYDKINLENYIDATIIPTDGFSIYKNKKKQELIRYLTAKNGAIVITDSDNAGVQIRAFIKNICKSENVINVYLPQIKGKEKRKARPSKQGFLGAEGLNGDIILSALKKSGVEADLSESTEKICKTDLFEFGLSGRLNSRSIRDSFSEFSGIPRGLSSNAFLDALNSIYSREEFLTEAKVWLREQVKN